MKCHVEAHAGYHQETAFNFSLKVQIPNNDHSVLVVIYFII